MSFLSNNKLKVIPEAYVSKFCYLQTRLLILSKKHVSQMHSKHHNQQINGQYLIKDNKSFIELYKYTYLQQGTECKIKVHLRRLGHAFLHLRLK